ncbi:MAG: 30S ribosomal protein S2 [Candidatus Marinimicrobia bacterium]|nr:30S ribosomal protein S2 [Candidatus Neomarinimicrobiota bacterium]
MDNRALVSVTNTQRDNMAEQVSFKDLLGTGAHFGHVTRKWHPNYEPYILMERNGVHIINLEETVKHLNTAIEFIKKVVGKNGEILFVGTKKQAKDIVQQEADRCGMYYIVERWLGGTLTNFSTIKKSIKRLKALEKEGSSIYENLTKKEIQMLNRERLKLSDQHRGIKDMRRLPEAIVIVDVDRELTALQEAIRLEIPVIAIIDSNCDPRIVNYPIPANDDSIRTIQLIVSALVDAIMEVKDESAVREEDISETSQKVDHITTKPDEVNATETVPVVEEVKVEAEPTITENVEKITVVDKKPQEVEVAEQPIIIAKPKTETKKTPIAKKNTKTKASSSKTTSKKTTAKTTVKKSTGKSSKK